MSVVSAIEREYGEIKISMAAETMNYNIHNILSIQISPQPAAGFLPAAGQPFTYFATNHVATPDIIMNLGPFKPDNKCCDIINHKIYVRPGYIYCSERVGNLRYGCEIGGLTSDVTYINLCIWLKHLTGRSIPSLIAQDLFLHPLIEFKLIQKGVLPVHATGVANRSGALLFIGCGHTYKTMLAIDLIRNKGYQFLGDDHVLLCSDGTVLACPMFHPVFEDRPQRETKKHFCWPCRPRHLRYRSLAAKMVNCIQEQSNLRSLYCIVKRNNAHIGSLALPKRECITMVKVNQQFESATTYPMVMDAPSVGVLCDYLTAYAFRFPYSSVGTYWSDYEKKLTQVIEHADCQELVVPEDYDDKVFRKLCTVLG